jgi:hypothetical protein
MSSSGAVSVSGTAAHEHGVGARKDLLASEAELKVAEARLEAAEKKLGLRFWWSAPVALVAGAIANANLGKEFGALVRCRDACLGWRVSGRSPTPGVSGYDFHHPHQHRNQAHPGVVPFHLAMEYSMSTRPGEPV